MRLQLRLCAIAAAVAIAACTPKPEIAIPEPPPPAAPVAANPLDRDQPNYLRLPGLGEGAPIRVGIILPFGSSAAGTRALAGSMMKAAELAMFDSGNRNILLMTADEGNGGAAAAKAAQQLLAQGAEVIVGPLFGPSVSVVAPIARDRGVPVLAFSTERSVAGNGAYLDRVEALVEAMLEDEDVRLPGDRRRKLRDEALKHGVDIPDTLMAQLRAMSGAA